MCRYPKLVQGNDTFFYMVILSYRSKHDLLKKGVNYVPGEMN